MSITKEQGDLFWMLTHQIRQLGCVFSGNEAAEVFSDLAEELKHTETNPTCEIHKSCRTSR